MSKINSFKFKRKTGGNTTLKFSTGHSKTVFAGGYVTIPASETSLLGKLDPSRNSLSVFELIGPGDVNEVGPRTEAEKALKALTDEPNLEKADGAKMRIVEASPGWFDIYTADDIKFNTKRYREDEARKMAGLGPKTTDGNDQENTESETTDE
jgi:hypothetical protein